MDTILHILKVIGIILLVVLSFNIIIFVHELGHFLAARWRGLQIDRFQIWFGKPIWKKTINGVQYGLGSIPAGGFVALPQMAPMEAIEGDNGEMKAPLPPITPMDKIIVAFAGPLFSFLLAVVAAFIVWGIGMPDTKDTNKTVGYIQEGGYAEKAGLKMGDKIIKVNDTVVTGFQGGLEGIRESIIFSEGDTIKLTVLRSQNGVEKEVILESGFSVKEGSFTQRSGLRTIGFGMNEDIFVNTIADGSPASVSGFKENDKILAINGEKIWSFGHFVAITHKYSEKLINVTVERDSKALDIKTMPMAPSNGFKADNDAKLLPMLGIGFKKNLDANKKLKTIHPNPAKQLKDAGMMMWTTLSKLVSPKSSINLGHMNGPIGIGEAQYNILSGPYAVQMIFYFWVIFNINLAIFNLLPLPVLDGGHITMAIGEMIRKKPMNTAVLEKIQVLFVMLLLGMIIFVSTKDIFHGRDKPDRTGLPSAPTFDLAPLKVALGLPVDEKKESDGSQ